MDELARLSEEVKSLRARLRRWMWGSVLGGAALAALCGVSFLRSVAPPDHLAVRRLELVNARGVVRARLGIDALGNAALDLDDSRGKSRARIEAGDEQSGVRLTGADQRLLARLSAVPGQSGLLLSDSRGPRSAVLEAGEDSTALRLEDHEHSLKALLRANPADTDLQLIRSPSDQPVRVAALGAGSDNADYGPGLTLAGPDQFLRATVNHADGEPRVVLGGATRVESRTGARGPMWVRGPRKKGDTPKLPGKDEAKPPAGP